MGFPIPWRCLIPLDAIEEVFPAGNTEACSQASGAQVHISLEHEAPQTLSDKILTISGSASQKEAACRIILRDLWKSQDIPPEEESIFVLIVPACAVGAIIGTKGVKIKEIMLGSGTDINVGRELIIGMPDNPFVINGSQDQILSATLMANAVLQELADRDNLKEDDFRYIPGRTPSAPRTGPRGSGAGPSARLAVSKGIAGFIIGRGGQKIRELKEQSGANIQFRSAEEEPALGLTEEERLLEVRGAEPEQRNQAVRQLLTEMDTMPDPPRATLLFLPARVERGAVEQAVAACGSPEVSMRFVDRAGTEQGVELEGPIFARMKAVFALLGLADECGPGGGHGEARGGGGHHRGAEAAPLHSSSPGDRAGPPGLPGGTLEHRAVSGAQRAPEEHRVGAAVAERGEEEEELRLEPDSGKTYNFAGFREAFRGTYSENDIKDYWRDACTPVAKRDPPTATGRQPPPQPQMQPQPQGQALSQPQMQHHTQPEPQAQPPPQPQQEQRPAQEPQQQPAQRPAQPQPQAEPRPQVHAQPQARPQPQEQPPPQPRPQQASPDLQHRPGPGLGPGPTVGPGPTLGPVAEAYGSMEFVPQRQPGNLGLDASGLGPAVGGFGMPGAFGAFAQMPGAPFGMPRSQLQLVLPASAVREKLIPGGHLAEIARGCRVQIDIHEELPNDRLRVALSGTVTANTLAALALQWRMWFAGC